MSDRVTTEMESLVLIDVCQIRGAAWNSHVTLGGGTPLNLQVRLSLSPFSVVCVDDIMFSTFGIPAVNDKHTGINFVASLCEGLTASYLLSLKSIPM